MKLPLYVIRRTEAAGGGYWNGAGWCREATEAYSEDERFWAIGSAWERDQNIEVIQLETSDAEPESEAEDPEVPPIITREYRDAMSGEGPLAYDWKDKPHRLVYDLCREVDRLRAEKPEPAKEPEPKHAEITDKDGYKFDIHKLTCGLIAIDWLAPSGQFSSGGLLDPKDVPAFVESLYQACPEHRPKEVEPPRRHEVERRIREVIEQVFAWLPDRDYPQTRQNIREALAFADANPPTEVSFEGKVGWTAEDRSGLQSLKVEWNDQCKSGSIPCGSRIRVTVLKEKAD